MATLKDGLYNICFVPPGTQPPSVGDLYATASEIGNPVVAETSSISSLRPWQVTRRDDGNYTITKNEHGSEQGDCSPPRSARSAETASSPGWSLGNPLRAAARGTIFFDNNCAEFELEPKSGVENTIYSIKVIYDPGAELDSSSFATVDDQKVIYQNFDIENRPIRWQFISV